MHANTTTRGAVGYIIIYLHMTYGWLKYLEQFKRRRDGLLLHSIQ